ncbi:MAG: beta-glucosidase [Frankiales bacterium]|jgi:beta-glucosidase|nr:beta-glucosidase [Frankiales bacterium]
MAAVALAAAAALLAPAAGASTVAHAAAAYPFRDPSLSLSARLDDLMSRLTLDEKIGLLHQYEQPIPRLGIALFKAGTEALHGVAWSNDANDNGNVVTATATVFPQALGLASTWDTALIQKVGSAVGDEARGLHAENPTVWGLNLWAPVVNLLRDPRWGRNEEGYSEDPTLTSSIATAYGSGMEGPDVNNLKAAPTLKHFLAYNNEVNRDTTSSNVTPQVLHEYDLQAFQSALQANAATGVMASYNLVNGRPMTVSPLLNQIRNWTNQQLFNPTDAYAPYNLTGSQQYYATQPEADAALFKAGIDSYIADNNNPQPMIDAVKAALAQGLLSVNDIETADRHALSIRFRLGEFDPNGGKYGGITAAAVNSPANQRLARKTADEAAVLLKNANTTLPLNATTTKTVAVIGPLEKTVYSDWYGGNPPYKVTPLQGIQERLGSSATVTDTEAADRIALQDVDTGKYVAATGSDATSNVTASAPGADDAAAQFDVFDWGQGIVTLRNVANGKVVGSGNGGFITHDEQPNGWFVQQQFKLEQQPDGTYVLHYAGYETTESWFGPNSYVTVGADGKLTLGAASAATATHFAKTTVSSGIASAVKAAKAAGTAVVVVGSMPFINGREAHDRTSMALASGQEALVKAVLAANPHTVVVLENSYPDTITWEQEHVPAILWTTHAGQETGHAVADVLFGDVNPSGRLTQTWYRSDQDLPSILDYDIVNSGETYLYYKGSPLYPFGYGLSYSTFRYSDLHTSATHVGPNGTVDVSVKVTNTSSRAGAEVVQLYTRQRTSSDKQPIKSLRTFARVQLNAGQSKVVHLSLKAADLAVWDTAQSAMVVEKSTYDVMVGASSADIRQRTTVDVGGVTVGPRDLSYATQAEGFDSYSGVSLVDTSKTSGTSVAATSDGQWVEYSRVALKPSQTTLAVTAAKATPGVGTVALRLDSPTGPLLGTVDVASTGDVYRYSNVETSVQPANGSHDVYLVLSDGVRVSSFQLVSRDPSPGVDRRVG